MKSRRRIQNVEGGQSIFGLGLRVGDKAVFMSQCQVGQYPTSGRAARAGAFAKYEGPYTVIAGGVKATCSKTTLRFLNRQERQFNVVVVDRHDTVFSHKEERVADLEMQIG